MKKIIWARFKLIIIILFLIVTTVLLYPFFISYLVFTKLEIMNKSMGCIVIST